MKNILFVGALSLTVSAAPTGLRAADFDQEFDGTWMGTIRVIDTSLYNPMELPPGPGEEPLELALEIEGDAARVLINAGKGWTEVKPGAFSGTAHKTNAVIVAIDSYILDDESAGWVETWNLTLTHKDDKTLYVYWVRAVNNYSVPAMTNPYARFFVSGFGELAQSAPITGTGRITVSETKYRARGCTHLQISCDTEAVPVHLGDREQP